MIKKQFKRVIKSITARAFKNELQSLKTIASAYQHIMEEGQDYWMIQHQSCEGIVFSKDRAMQLHSLLSSYFAHVKNPVKLYILYTTSHARHAESYKELKHIFNDKEIVFIEEKSFKPDLEKILNTIQTIQIFFMTDDGLFIDSFDMKEILLYNPIRVIPTLIKGLDLTYCYIWDKKQALPEFIKPEGLMLPSFMKCWEWGKAECSSDWAYPLSLDVSFYNKKEIQALIKNVFYKGPNSLETALHQNYAPIFLQRKGVCFDKAKYVNIVCNVVNTEHPNRNTGLHSTEDLLEKWEAGYRIHYEYFFGLSCLDAEKSSFAFIKR